MSKFKLAIIFLAVFSLFSAHQAGAIGLSEKEKACAVKKKLISLQIPIIGACVESDSVCCSEDGNSTVAVKGAPDYVNVIFRFGVIFIAVLLVGVLAVAGLMYISSGGNPAVAGKALDYVKNAAYSLVVLIFSVVILNQIDPRLTSLNISNIVPVPVIKCCKLSTSDDYYFSSKKDDANQNYVCNKGDTEVKENFCSNQNVEEEDDVVQNPLTTSAGQIVPIIGDNITVAATENTIGTSVLPSLQAAATSIKANYKVIVTSGLRTVAKQKELITLNCQNPAGSQTCNPKPGRPTTCILRDLNPNNCPHTTGVAVDAWGATLDGKQCISQSVCKSNLTTCFNNPCQKALIDAMKAQGFCVLSIEPWHFEKPKLSAKCN